MPLYPKRESWQVCAGYYSPADEEYSWAVLDEFDTKKAAQEALNEQVARSFDAEELVTTFKHRVAREAEYARRSDAPLVLLRVISQVDFHLPVREPEDA